MELIQATERDLENLLAFYQHVAQSMVDGGLRQWNWGVYPSEEMIREDVLKGEMYILPGNAGTIDAAVVVTPGQEPVYENLDWSCGIRPGMIHRLAVEPVLQGHGLAGLVLDDAQKLLRAAGCDCVRCDTAENNRNAIRMYEKMGFRRCSSLNWPDTDCGFVAFDKPLKRETPLWPIRMKPAFRDGEETPWGGTRLHDLFGKETKDRHTGESLEVSCIPGLESEDSQGRKLPELITEFGEKMVGGYAGRAFPLLLKLLDARERLSVQVHPDDAYAAARENGKFGKTEAWLILDTPPEGGKLVYGLRPGTTLKELKEACASGEEMKKLLNRVKVFPGDVCYIPAGCVHAIGEGVLLYELQQSSDITYRFYDWERKDEQGRKRKLHLDKALDVVKVKCASSPMRVEKAFGIRRVLSEAYFTLDLIRTDSMVLLPQVEEFGILTVTEGETELRFPGASMKLKVGETCLIPKQSPELALVGCGAAALAMPVGAPLYTDEPILEDQAFGED